MAARRGGRRRGGDDDGGDTWLTTYADAITLLMAFFVMLYAMSEVDVTKFKAFVEGLAVPFGNESGEGLMPASDGLAPEQPSVMPTAEVAADVTVAEEATPTTPEERERLDEVAEALDQALADAGLSELVEQRIEQRGLVVSIASDDVLFALGSTDISRLGRRVIATVARTLEGFPNELVIEGHTDDLPLARPGYSNWNLSTDRAVAVLDEMITEHGLPPVKVSAAGYGEFRPLADNDTRSGRSRNRRVDIVVLHEEKAP
ncbi:flagellar motor protein MotB [Nitriliruptoraceae bacterium ZYF776]|nr:flagellar motor protein MotB [Profundirhabdus halotolerans]